MNKNLYIIGCGGIGSILAPLVCRWNSYTKIYSSITLVDGDIVEPKNLSRQGFFPSDVGKNKALVLMDKCPVEGYDLIHRPVYVNEKVLHQIVNESGIVHLLVAVDNDKTKAEINNFYKKLDDVAMIIPANGHVVFDCHIAIRSNGKDITPDFTWRQPDIQNPKDKSPLELGCDREVEQFPQNIFANLGAATFACTALYALNCEKDFKPFEALHGSAAHVAFRREEFPDGIVKQYVTT